MTINKVFFTMEICIANLRMHSMCVIGWVGLGSGMANETGLDKERKSIWVKDLVEV